MQEINQGGKTLKKLISKPLDETEIKINLNKNIDTFLIAEKSCEKEFRKKFSEIFISTGCKNFTVFGKYAFEWELALDEAHIEIFGDSEEIAMTSVVEDFDDFVDEINDTLIINTENVFLFYDDLTAYNKVEKTLIKLKEGISK